MNEYQFTILRNIVVRAHVCVSAKSEDQAKQFAMNGKFTMVEEGERVEEFTRSVVSLDAVEPT